MNGYHLSAHDLLQLDAASVAALSGARARWLLQRALEGLRRAQEWIERTPQTSSLPPSSQPPWAQAQRQEGDAEEMRLVQGAEADERLANTNVEQKADAAPTAVAVSDPQPAPRRRAGKQPGAVGYGRGVELAVMAEVSHYPQRCAACGAGLGAETEFQAWTGCYRLEVERGEPHRPGLGVVHSKHLYYEGRCGCGHLTREAPGRGPAEPLAAGEETAWEVALSEWHLVGSMLMSLIVCLALRMRLPRARIQELLAEWLGVYLSVGVLNQCLHEAGRAVEPVEEQLVAALNAEALLHADETSWPEHGQGL